MEAYINGLSTVSPQNTFPSQKLPEKPVEYRNVRFLKCIDPPYGEYLDPMAARRMSRVIKNGVCTAMKALHEADIKHPDAIITGTGFGCVEDTGRFLNNIFENEEKLLNPTPFIQSTHNTVAASIALTLKCNNYNNTFGHRALSFENALLDGLMLLNEGEAENVLAGGVDELTTDLFNITNRIGLWKRETVDNLRLMEYRTAGTLPGEGSAFFVLGSARTSKSLARIISVDTLFCPSNHDESERWPASLVEKHKFRPDLVLTGINGDPSSDAIFERMKNYLPENIPEACYKHLCGEYDTSTGFALAMAAAMINEQHVPDYMMKAGRKPEKLENLLILNHNSNRVFSAIMISSC